jgi:hypothetical protein
MSANCLSLNRYKSEFLHISLFKQHSKVSDIALLVHSNVMITLSDSACNLGVIFDHHSPHRIKFPLTFFLIRRRSRIERLSVLLLLHLLLHLSFITRKAIATLSSSTFLALNLIVFNWFSTLRFVLFLRLLDSLSFHLFLNLHRGSKLTNTFTKKFSQSPTKHYLASPPISVQSSPYPY